MCRGCDRGDTQPHRRADPGKSRNGLSGQASPGPPVAGGRLRDGEHRFEPAATEEDGRTCGDRSRVRAPAGAHGCRRARIAYRTNHVGAGVDAPPRISRRIWKDGAIVSSLLGATRPFTLEDRPPTVRHTLSAFSPLPSPTTPP